MMIDDKFICPRCGQVDSINRMVVVPPDSTYGVYVHIMALRAGVVHNVKNNCCYECSSYKPPLWSIGNVYKIMSLMEHYPKFYGKLEVEVVRARKDGMLIVKDVNTGEIVKVPKYSLELIN